MKIKNKYTVVGYFEDNGQINVSHVEASDWQDAIVAAVKDLEARDNDRTNIVIVEVFSGHHKGLTDHNEVVTACDFPGLEQ